MLRIIRFFFIQKKFAGSSKVNQHEMILYNEKPQKSFVLGLDKVKKKALLPRRITLIRSKHSKTLCSTEQTHVVLYTNTSINTPMIQDWIDHDEVPVIGFSDIVKWLAKTPDSGSKEPVQPGARIGRLDAANEAGFFYRTNRSRLKDIKKKLKDKIEDSPEPDEPKKSE